MKNIGRAGNFNRWIGCRRPHRTAQIKTDNHGFSPHDARHFILDIFESIAAVHQFSQRIDLFTLIVNIKRAIDDSPLFVFEIIMDGMILHGQLRLLAFFNGQVSDKLPVFIRSRIDKHTVRIAKHDCVGNFPQNRLILDQA